MKKKVVKGLLTLSLVGALALSGVTTSGTGLGTVEAAKVVDKTELSPVTGIGYDAEENRLYCDKVLNATRYYFIVTDLKGNEVHWDYEFDPYDTAYLDPGTYNVTVKAVDRNNYYVVAEDVAYSAYSQQYDSKDWYRESKGNGKYTYYKYPSSTSTAQILVTESGKKTVTNAVTAMPNIQQKEVNPNRVVFEPSVTVPLNVDEQIIWEYSNNDKFINNSKKNLKASTDKVYWNDTDQTTNIYFSNFTPGETIYVRARVYNPSYNLTSSSEAKYSAYSNTLTYTVKKAKVYSVTTVTDTSSVTLNVSTTYGAVTGYQFAKKVGSKWVTLDTQTDPCYVDSGLLKNTKYQYRVRAYSYNKATNKTVWTDWYTVNATTWGSNLNVKAAAQSATSAKITWKPVSGAEGYEIYRYDTDSYSRNMEKGTAVESFDSMYLIKTIKKASTKSFTEKKLNKNASYTYIVRAYRTIGKQKIYIQDSASVSLCPDSMDVTTYKTAAGKVVATWSKQTGIKGYYVEKLDKETNQYVRVKTLKASATSYTFPKVNVGSEAEKYRIRPYDKTTIYSGSSEITVSASLAAPTNVKATRTATGVQVTWKAVAGADYYIVYRTKNGSYTYDKTRKTYDYSGGQTVYEGAVNTANCMPELGEAGYKSVGTYVSSQIRGTSVEDKALTYKVRSKDENGNYIQVGTTSSGEIVYQVEEAFYNNVQGPEAGTTYYYYVVACVDAPNGQNAGSESLKSADSKAAKITYTNSVAKKVSKITSVKSSKKGQATISYKKVKGVEGYAIYRSTKKNGTYVLVGTTTKTKFTDASAPTGKTCYYKVASYVKGEKKANIYSAKTAAKKVKIK